MLHQKLPETWIQRIFDRLENKYKESWLIICNDKTKSYLIPVWQNGLVGLTVDEVKRALLSCELTDYQYPPTVVQFYHYAKGLRVPPKVKIDILERGDPEVAEYYLKEIKRKVSNKRNDDTE